MQLCKFRFMTSDLLKLKVMQKLKILVFNKFDLKLKC